ncbi:MAG TPA: hypothetical protein VIM79_22185, partial [Niastella sp.]
MEGYADDIKPLSYSRKEWLIAVITLPPFAVLLNFVLFGIQYFTSLKNFLIATGITLLVITVVYVCCGMVAVMLRNRFPKYSQTFKRITIGLLIYMSLMTAAISILFWGY